MKNWLLCFALFSSMIFGSEYQLKTRLEKAKVGDYVVMEANKMVTLLALRSLSPTTLILEEISAPIQNLKKRPSSWAEWVKNKAPGATSWSMIEIDLDSAEILECYSFSRNCWLQIAPKESLFATLLHLPLKPQASDQLKKIGPPPMPGEPDVRKIWAPPLIFQGKQIENVTFDVLTTSWPKDGSELAGQDVILYFDKELRFAFPFWVQVETSHATAALRTIDSGKNLPIVHAQLPRRVPEFIGLPQKNEKGLRLHLKCPKYYREFELFAIDVTTREKQICPIDYTLVQDEGESVCLQIKQEELKEVLVPDHRYTWLLVPMGHSESYTETHKPFVWSTKE